MPLPPICSPLPSGRDLRRYIPARRPTCSSPCRPRASSARSTFAAASPLRPRRPVAGSPQRSSRRCPRRPTGSVVGLLLLPTLIGGYLIATMLFSVSQSAASAAGFRSSCVLGAVALITGSRPVRCSARDPTAMSTLLPCFALSPRPSRCGVALQSLVGRPGPCSWWCSSSSSRRERRGFGASLLPTFCRRRRRAAAPHAVELYRSVRYFDGHGIALPIAVLLAYALLSTVVIVIATCSALTRVAHGHAAVTDAGSCRRTRSLRRVRGDPDHVLRGQLHELWHEPCERHAVRRRRPPALAQRRRRPLLLTSDVPTTAARRR